MYSVDCTPTCIVPVDRISKSADYLSTPPRVRIASEFPNTGTGSNELGAPNGSARRFSSFSSLAAAFKGERASPLLSCPRPSQIAIHEQQAGLLPQDGGLAQPVQAHRQPQQQLHQAMRQVARVGGRGPYSSSFQEWLPPNETRSEERASSRTKKHQRLSAGNRGKLAANPYRLGARTGGPRMSGGPSGARINSPSPPRSTAAAEKDLAAITGGGAVDIEDEGFGQLGGAHVDDNSGTAGYHALQNALACVVASGRSAELLIWGARCLIERDFPCLYNRPGRTFTGLDLPSELPAKSLVSAEVGVGVYGKAITRVVSSGGLLDRDGAGAAGANISIMLQQEQRSGSSGELSAKGRSSNSSTDDGPGMSCIGSDPRNSLIGTSAECCCSNGACVGRQVVVVSVEGHRQRDRRVLKWVRHNLLRSKDIVVLIIAWERAEEPKYLRVPGMILSSSVDASSYNLTMATRLTSRLKQLGASFLSDCRVYPLVVPLARVTKAPVGSLLCQCARELQADLLVVGSHGHTSLRQVLCGSVSRHVRSHAPCKVVMPRV